MTKIKKLKVIILLVGFYLLISTPTWAARIYLSPQPGIHQVGDSVNFSVILDTEGETINAVDISIKVPELFRIKKVSKEGTMVQLWITEPSFSGNVVHFTGGIPGGISTAQGVVGKLSLEASTVGEGNIAFLSDSSVLLNDGQGTKLQLGAVGGPGFNVVPRPKETETTETQKAEEDTEKKKEKVEEAEEVETKVAEDKKKPAKFEILIGEDPRVFDGGRFISFFAVDKDSGIDRYEVKLGKESFTIAQSPYLIKDAPPRTVIRVRAYDFAENYREAVYPGLFKRIWWWLITLF